ncbi:hypothetical protein [Photobacterium sp. GSS17]|uniref:hypothetical protein n=1 Tax=Photobacterium sp. GSS17 TaxID=3020715 RepID=UPI00235FA821|nr:hypothetical protein [Photobacterium sp. GSS17]
MGWHQNPFIRKRHHPVYEEPEPLPASQPASQPAPIRRSKAADTSGLTNELILFHIGIYPAAVNGASR